MSHDRFRSHDGLEIAYASTGTGEPGSLPMLLVHGFASNLHTNWRLPGWIEAFQKAGRRVVCLDCRGHGESERPHDPLAYAGWAMLGDVIALMNHLEIQRADLMGYSMGGRLSAGLLVEAGERFGRAVLAGVGGSLLDNEGEATRAARIARALEASDPDELPAAGRAFREFAERHGGDPRALAACMRGMPRALTADRLLAIENPVLVAVGRDDDLVGDPRVLAESIPGGELAVISGRDHLTAVPARATKQAVFAFLELALQTRAPAPETG